MRKILSFLMISLMAVSLSAKTIYLNTGGASLWNQADAVFFAHSWGSEDSDVLMTLVEGDVFSAEIPDGNTSVVFVRMAPGSEAINWDTKWNQSTDQQIPNDQNCFTMTDWSNGTWSVYAPAAEDGDAIVLTFTCHNSTSGDGSVKLSTVEAIFDEASQAYVSEVNVGSDVYAGRKYAEGSDSIFSNLKLGTSSKAGELKFTLANPTEVDSIVFRAAMYANNEGGNGFSVNGTAFTLSAGKLLFEDKVWKPTGEVSSIDIVQTTANKGRFFLTSITIYPKAGDTPAQDPTVSVFGTMTDPAWEVEVPFVLSDDKTYATLTVENIGAGEYDFKFFINGEWRSNGYRYHRGFPGAAGITENNAENMIFAADVDGEYTFYWYFANDSAAIVYPEAPVVIPAKFYLTGDSALVVDAGLEANKAWAPAAIKSETDTMTLTLLAKQEYKLKITLDGDWATGKGYSSLSEKPEGVSSDNDDNIIFSLVEAGEVNVIYVATEDTTIFKVEGNFYVAPAQDPTVSVFGTMTDPAWEVEVPFVLSDDKTYATLTVENIGAGEYAFKFFVNGEWRSNGYTYHRGFPGAAGITENNEANMIFQADVDGEYTFYWYFANDSAAIIYPEKEEPALTNGYYLVGSMNEWTPAAENLFEVNPENEGEYQLAINLDENDAIKVVYVENDAIVTWFPAEGDNYVVDHNHAGPTTMYFRPDYYEDWAAFGGYFYIVPTDHVAIDNIDANAPAVKILRDGQILIIKGDKTFNAQGQLVK